MRNISIFCAGALFVDLVQGWSHDALGGWREGDHDTGMGAVSVWKTGG